MRLFSRWTSRATSSRALLRALPLLAILFLVVSVAHQYFNHGRWDRYKCQSLVSEGRWRLDDQPRRPEHAFAEWAPHGCRMHVYGEPNLNRCLSGRRLLFVGDSTIRQLYWAALRRLDRTAAEIALADFEKLQDKETDLSSTFRGVQVDFLWDPWLDSTKLFGQMSRFRTRPGTPDHEARVKEEDRDSPAVIVLGTPAVWSARASKGRYLEVFRKGINHILHYLHDDVDDNIVLPGAVGTAAYRELSNQVFIAPAPTPAIARLPNEEGRGMTPKKIDKMNEFLRNSDAIDQSHVLWAFDSMTEGRDDAYVDDGLHVVDRVADWRLDVILNARCNVGLARDGFANQLSCCVPYPQPSFTQMLLLFLGAVGLPWMLLDGYKDAFVSVHPKRTMSCFIAGGYLLAFAGYCYIADRTHLFVKQDRHLDGTSLALSLLAVGLLALASISKHGAESEEGKEARPLYFLDRYQTDEWKGWMAAALLVFNFNGASSSPALYKLSRLFVSTFIFLSSYGNTRYFLQTGDFSLRRVARVVCRLNLLSLILGLTLGSGWTLYYIGPLFTFWFGITYTVIASFKRWNGNTTILCLKIAVATLVTLAVIHVPGVLGEILQVLEERFVSDRGVGTVRSHLFTDQLTPFFGMLVAVFTNRYAVLRRRLVGGDAAVGPFKKFNEIFDRQLLDTLHPVPGGIPAKNIATFSSGLLLGVFLVCVFGTSSQGSNDAYDTYHPYGAPWLILSMVILRNSHSTLRKARSTAAMALGRLSLELSVLQYHVWLAGDASAVLRIVPRGEAEGATEKCIQATETIVISVVFLSAAVKCRSATQQFVNLVAGDRDKGKEELDERGNKGSV